MKRRIALALLILGLGAPLFAQAIRNVPRISIADTKVLMAKKRVLLIDVRDAQSFAEGHMPGAINIPFAEITAHADKLRKETRQIVTYCA